MSADQRDRRGKFVLHRMPQLQSDTSWARPIPRQIAARAAGGPTDDHADPLDPPPTPNRHSSCRHDQAPFLGSGS